MKFFTNIINEQILMNKKLDELLDKVNLEDVDSSEYAINNYCDVVRSEYEYELAKKQSFENRAGILLTVYAAVAVLIIKNVNLIAILEKCTTPTSFELVLVNLAGIGIYILTALTFINLHKILSIQKYENFGIQNLNDSLFFENKLEGIVRITKSYIKVVLKFRENNKRDAEILDRSIKMIVAVLILYSIFINFTGGSYV